jgi:cytochrome oxidase Cu insertion factor (SCO1/SenC/PrrC family)
VNQPSKALPWTIGLGLLLFLLCLALAFVYAGLNSRAAHHRRMPVYAQVGDFTLTNQSCAAVSLADLHGRVWVADIIFTRCAGPCLTMSRQMKELQTAFPPESRARLVSLTTDPDFDTPPVLLKYAERFGADTNRWMFLTGTRNQIGALAAGSLKLSAVGIKPADRVSPDDLFVHSTIFVVVDKPGRLRGVFQTAGEGVSWPIEKRKILAAVRQLEREE